MTNNNYIGYVVYSKKNKPIGLVSSDGEKRAICKKNSIPSRMYDYLVKIEDKRFYSHKGIDPYGIARALWFNVKHGRLAQGGSTITQQLSRNILNDKSKTIKRKLKESFLAVYLESKYDKDKILEEYFNNVYFGKNIFGLRAASLTYFYKEPNELSVNEQLSLLTLLQGPNYYLNNLPKLDKRNERIVKTLKKTKSISTKHGKAIKSHFKDRSLPCINDKCIQYIANNIETDNYKIKTNIDQNLQKQIALFIKQTKYPTSCIVISRNSVIGFGSTYGSDYPYAFKTNIGSTIKPFLYITLRENGLDKNDIISTENYPDITWEIKEAQKANKDFLTLGEALLLSNNNAFVNASNIVGFEKILYDLAKKIGIPNQELVKSSVLGAFPTGMSLYEIVKLYDTTFANAHLSDIEKECLDILKNNAYKKSSLLKGYFLKTGTTNNNEQRFLILGNKERVIGFLREKQYDDYYGKEGSFFEEVIKYFKKNNKRGNFKWM
jgi:penicillin-binding protein 1A